MPIDTFEALMDVPLSGAAGRGLDFHSIVSN